MYNKCFAPKSLTESYYLGSFIALLSNDIALIKLTQPAEMSQYVSVMGLNERKDLAENLVCEIGGWGQMLSGN